MISHGKVAEKPSLDGDKSANPPQAPMTLQNTGPFGSNELHPRKLVQLVGSRLVSARQEKPKATTG
jgi:hypothetical protein